ncbi:MAG TPA: class F sortase [Caldilineaceae bacterium]|nr:class F sortase [Caldilineaceae bacterium]
MTRILRSIHRPYLWSSLAQGTRRRSLARSLGLLWATAGLALAACQSGQATPTPPAAAAGTPAAGVVVTGTNPAAATLAGEVAEIEPLPTDQTTGPVRLQIPAINLDVPIIAMGWRLGVVDGRRTTVWDVPTDKAGWHINSAGAGGAGNTIISGRQVGGEAVFAPLALGVVQPGQEVYLTDGDGVVWVYRISEVTEPIPITGATPEDEQLAASYFAPTQTARLTLVTGWPEFTTTHRVFAVADFVGVQR